MNKKKTTKITLDKHKRQWKSKCLSHILWQFHKKIQKKNTKRKTKKVTTEPYHKLNKQTLCCLFSQPSDQPTNQRVNVTTLTAIEEFKLLSKYFSSQTSSHCMYFIRFTTAKFIFIQCYVMMLLQKTKKVCLIVTAGQYAPGHKCSHVTDIHSRIKKKT